MKVISIVVFRWISNDDKPIILASHFELSSFGFFQRGTVKEGAIFVSREVSTRTKLGERQTIRHEGHLCHTHVNYQKLACSVLTDDEYPVRVAFALIGQVFEEFTKQFGNNFDQYTKDVQLQCDALEVLIRKYQNPNEADSVLKIQKDLDETKGILIKSIDQLLVRGDKLENLAQRSEDLSFQSKAFMKNSQKMNSCCTII